MLDNGTEFGLVRAGALQFQHHGTDLDMVIGRHRAGGSHSVMHAVWGTDLASYSQVN